MKIEKSSKDGTTLIRLIGAFESEELPELKEHIPSTDIGANVVVDLKEVTLVDVDVVRFLVLCKTRGMKLVNCAQYIRDWMLREQKRKQ